MSGTQVAQFLQNTLVGQPVVNINNQSEKADIIRILKESFIFLIFIEERKIFCHIIL